MVTPIFTAALTLSSLAARLGAEEMLNVGWRNWNVRAISSQLSDRDASRERDGMVETLIVTPRGCRDRETKEESWDTGR